MRHRNGRLYLLDFGAVKQVTKAGAAGGAAGRSTGIYSMGFAPPEQMSGSQVYPSTDLYALAVTLITLLTGKEAGELYDSYNNQWNWRNYAQVSDTLADVLDRMLLATPNQRYGSAQEVMDALDYRPTPQPLPSPPPSNPLPQRTTAPPTNPLPVQASTPTAAPPVSQPPSNPPVTVAPSSPPRSRRGTFSTLELLRGAAFTGFEGALLFIALGSLLPSPALGIGLWGMVMGGLIFAQFRRVIEKFDFVIIAVITLLPLVFFPALRNDMVIQTVIVLSVLAAAGAIAVTALFRLVYLLLSRLL
jgi:serine/threonine-protein kinase